MNESQLIFRKTIQDAVDQYLQDQEVVRNEYQPFMRYLKDGNRLEFEALYFERRRKLAVFGLNAYFNPSEENLCFLEEIIWSICNEYTWSLPAHLDSSQHIYDSNSPQMIDLFASETGQTLAELTHLLGEHLSQMIKERVRLEIDRRIFMPFEAKKWHWETVENNWNSVVGGCVGMCAFYQLPFQSSRQQAIVYRIKDSFSAYLDGFYEDGACLEGVSYWSYGFGYYIYFAEMLREQYGDASLLTSQKVKNIAAFPYHSLMSDDNFVPFSDYNKTLLPSGLLSYCHRQFGVEIPEIKAINPLDFDHCYRFAQLIRNYEWTELHAEKVVKDIKFYPDAQWFFARYPEEKMNVAFKGGRNDESHNHNDLGHFILGDMRELFLTDLGAGEYVADYFKEETRYNFLNNAAEGHSIPIIDGYSQVSGSVSSSIHDASVLAEEQMVCYDLTDTYAKESRVNSFRRRFDVNANNRELLITDEFHFESAQNKVVENYITIMPPVVTDHIVTLANKEMMCRIEMETANIVVEEKVYSNHKGETKTAFLIQAHFNATEDIKIQAKVTLQKI